MLDRNASSVLKILARTRPILPKLEHKEGFSSFKMRSPRPTLIRNVELPGREVDSGCGISETEGSLHGSPGGSFEVAYYSTCTGVDSSAPTPARFRSNSDTSSATLKVNLLSRRAGRPRLARVGQALALAAQQGVYDREPLTTEMVVETIEGAFPKPSQVQRLLTARLTTYSINICGTRPTAYPGRPLPATARVPTLGDSTHRDVVSWPLLPSQARLC